MDTTAIRDRIVKFTRVKAGELDPHPKNPRTHPPSQVRAIRAALTEIGYADALKVRKRNGRYQILDGHLRAEVTPDHEVPVLVLDLDDVEAEKMLATFDPIGDLAGLDAEGMSDLAAGIEFDAPELADVVAGVTSDGSREARQDNIPDVPADPITKAGDVWELGDHRIVCGDCRDLATVEASGVELPAELVITDPPYCSGGFQEAGKAAGTWGTIASDNLSTRGFAALMRGWIAAARPQTTYIFTDWRMWIPLFDVVEGSGLAVRSMIVWDKGTPGLGILWRTQHELVMFSSRTGNTRVKGVPARGNVIQAKRTGNKEHYTEKPVSLLGELMTGDEPSGRRGSVFDPFLGSGSTLIAAEQVGRRCYGLEVEPGFVDVTLRRWSTLTGGKSKRQSDGRKFEV